MWVRSSQTRTSRGALGFDPAASTSLRWERSTNEGCRDAVINSEVGRHT